MAERGTPPATVVLVHGAWHGAWCWDKVTSLLGDAGVPSVAVDLPGGGGLPGDLLADAAAVRAVLDALEGPALLCGHSYGGAVITEAGGHPSVARLVYIAAFVPDAGEALADAAGSSGSSGSTPPPRPVSASVGDDGLVRLDPEGAQRLYHDCSPADAEAAVSRLRPQRADGFRQRVSAAAWRTRPSTYALCTEDRAVEAGLQRRMAERAGAEIVEWPTGHSPFLCRPDLVAALLVALSAEPATA